MNLETVETICKRVDANGPTWKCNTPALLQEIMNNKGTSVLKQPLNIFLGILVQAAERVAELGDDKLIDIFLRLSLLEPCGEDPS